jgi:hypothetical protein
VLVKPLMLTTKTRAYGPAARVGAWVRQSARLAAAVVLLLGVPWSTARAQGPETPTAGARIRATIKRDGTEWTGELLTLGGDTLRLRPQHRDYAVAIPVSSVARLDVSRGTRPAARKGALIGGLSGMALGMFVEAMAQRQSSRHDSLVFGDGAAMVLMGVIGFGAGTVVGLIVGSNTHVDRWERVRLPPAPGH